MIYTNCFEFTGIYIQNKNQADLKYLQPNTYCIDLQIFRFLISSLNYTHLDQHLDSQSS